MIPRSRSRRGVLGLLLLALVACDAGAVATAPPPVAAPAPSASSDVAPEAPPRRCELEGTSLEGDVCDATGQRLATLRLRGGSFELTVGAKGSSARGSRSGVLFDGEVCTEGLHVWPKEQLDLIEGHAWIEPQSEVSLSSAGRGALQPQATPESPELAGPFDCALFWLTPGPPPRAEDPSYPSWIVLNAPTVPVFDEAGRPLRTWIGEGRTLYQPTLLGEGHGMRRLKYQLGPVVWDVWLRSEAIEFLTLPFSNRRMDVGGISPREEGSFRPRVARRASPARIARLAQVTIGETPDKAVASGITPSASSSTRSWETSPPSPSPTMPSPLPSRSSSGSRPARSPHSERAFTYLRGAAPPSTTPGRGSPCRRIRPVRRSCRTPAPGPRRRRRPGGPPRDGRPRSRSAGSR